MFSAFVIYISRASITLDILYTFTRHVHFIEFSALKFSINV